MNIMITGASGYIGLNLINYFSNIPNINLTLLSTNEKIEEIFYKHKIIKFKNFYDVKFNDILPTIDVILHLISKQHSIRANKDNFYNDYYETNVNIAAKLANDAKKFKVKHFIYFSTIKVYGEYSYNNYRYNVDSIMQPVTSYAKTKLITEIKLKSIFKKSQTNLTILRLPLVYGDKEKGNLKILTKYINLGFPIPFKNLENKRTLLNIKNLIDFTNLCINSKMSYNQDFIVSDDVDLSSIDLIQGIKKKLNKKNLIFKSPLLTILKIFNKIFKKNLMKNFYLSFICSNIETKKIMNWKPKYDFNDYVND